MIEKLTLPGLLSAIIVFILAVLYQQHDALNDVEAKIGLVERDVQKSIDTDQDIRSEIERVKDDARDSLKAELVRGGECRWKKIGHSRSHYDQGKDDYAQWCNAGEFIRRIDLDICEKSGDQDSDCKSAPSADKYHFYPIIGFAECCELLPD